MKFRLVAVAVMMDVLCIFQTAQDERYAFIAEWYDPQAALIRRYQFLFYPKDNSIEMVTISPNIRYS